ncbi:hypothetical protein ACFP81_05295 [Deinococcus lacus]|uniref:Uncharacterized protein n=1 Tax=Deinococcus lacus TaxID=392561 RepID=A0ABW1YE27_9DEIO
MSQALGVQRAAKGTQLMAAVTAHLLALAVLAGYGVLVWYGVWGLFLLTQGQNAVLTTVLLITAPLALLLAVGLNPLRLPSGRLRAGYSEDGMHKGILLAPDDAPTLHGLVQAVAAAAQCPPPAWICLTADFGVHSVATPRGTGLHLGMPLLYGLDPQARAALLAGALAAPRRAGLLEVAEDMLCRASELLKPSRRDPLVVQLSRGVPMAALQGLHWILVRLHHLQTGDEQRQAVCRAAQVAGARRRAGAGQARATALA